MKDMTSYESGSQGQLQLKKSYQLATNRIRSGDTVLIPQGTSGVVLWDGPPKGRPNELYFKPEYNCFHASAGEICLVLDIAYMPNGHSQSFEGWAKVLWREKILYTWISFYGECWLSAA